MFRSALMKTKVSFHTVFKASSALSLDHYDKHMDLALFKSVVMIKTEILSHSVLGLVRLVLFGTHPSNANEKDQTS